MAPDLAVSTGCQGGSTNCPSTWCHHFFDDQCHYQRHRTDPACVSLVPPCLFCSSMFGSCWLGGIPTYTTPVWSQTRQWSNTRAIERATLRQQRSHLAHLRLTNMPCSTARPLTGLVRRQIVVPLAVDVPGVIWISWPESASSSDMSGSM